MALADLIIRGGIVFDGTGDAPFEADVAVKNGRIAAVGHCDGPAVEVIDAGGKMVTPGDLIFSQAVVPMNIAFTSPDGLTENGFRFDAACIASTAERIRADIASLASTIAARAGEFENLRRIPIDLIAELKSIGVFRMLSPKSHGGLEFDLPIALEIIATLASVEGSVGWTAMIGCGGNLFTPMLRRETCDQIYQHGPNMIFTGSVQPTGTAEEAPGEWRVSGRCPFASGCLHADWMIGLCIMIRNGEMALFWLQEDLGGSRALPSMQSAIP
jgi:hypothetical protein